MRARIGASLLAGLLGWGLLLSAFWPGMLSFDAAVMWFQARGAPIDTIHSPFFTLVWRGLSKLGDSPAPVFVLYSGLFWAVLAMLAASLEWRAGRAALFVLLAGLCPPVFVLASRISTDIALVACLGAAVVCILRAMTSKRFAWWLVAALLFSTGAGLMRHNAWPALLPLAWFIATRRPAGSSRRLMRIIAALCLGLPLLATIALRPLVEQHRSVWPATTIWDLAAISISTGELLLPASITGPGMTVDDLEQAFEPWGNLTIFTRTRAGMRAPFLTPAQASTKQEVLWAWWRAVRQHPDAWLRHRLSLMRMLVGSKGSDLPHQLTVTLRSQTYKDNPVITPRHDSWHRFWIDRLSSAASAPWLAAWPWLLVYLPALGLAWRRRRRPSASLGLVVLSSGIAYALPLFVVAPSAELRFLGWTVVAGWMGLGLALGGVEPASGSGAADGQAA